MEPKVSIVIPTFNRAVMLERLLLSVDSSSYKNIELIVVNDCSTDDTLNMLKRIQKIISHEIIIINNEVNRNLSASRNIGMKSANGIYIFLIDDDNVLNTSCISALVTVLEKNSDVGMVGPVMYFFSSKEEIWWAGTRRNMTTSRTFFIGRDIPMPNTDTWETDDFPNAWMFRSSIVKMGIVLDESFVIHYDESDFAMRVQNFFKYYFLVVKNAKIYHDVESDCSESMSRRWLDTKRVFYTARNRIIFQKKYAKPFQYLAFILFWNWIFTIYYLNFIFQIPKANNKDRFKSSIAYIKGVFSGLN